VRALHHAAEASLRSPLSRLSALLMMVALATGCGASGDDIRLPPLTPEDWVIHWAQTFDPADVDGDGLPDAAEDWIAARWAPELRLPPDDVDWTRPASVDWYLPYVHMRFDHPRCLDHEVLPLGGVTQQNLSRQTHELAEGVGLCSHTGEVVSSGSDETGFFLQPPDDAVHAGSSNPADWRTYVHVKPSASHPGAVDIQYWFFFPYNDWVATVNHEADWEHITVVASGDGTLRGVWYANHNGGDWYEPGEVPLTPEGRPVVYVADGSHASYPVVGTFNHGPGFDDRTYDGGPVWRAWENWVNVGERGAVRNGQHFIEYGGRWGEVGETSFTSGPQGPAFQDAWNAL
jgi:hypothetical protein